MKEKRTGKVDCSNGKQDNLKRRYLFTSMRSFGLRFSNATGRGTSPQLYILVCGNCMINNKRTRL